MLTPDQSQPPEIVRTIADIERFERTPWQDRLPVRTTYEILHRACRRFGHRPALRLLLAPTADAPTLDVSYAALLEGVHRTANALRACGIGSGSAVTILLPNLVEGHFALWGAQAAGIASPVNPMLEAAYIARICEETQAEVLIALGPTPGFDLWDKAVQVAERVGTVQTVLQVNVTPPSSQAGQPVGPLPRRQNLRVLDFHAALAAADAHRLSFARAMSSDEPCAYFHTGGTTGYPKVAVHSHLNEAFMACALRWIDERVDVVLAGLPLFHVNGAMVTGLGAFHRGAQVVMLTPAGYRAPGLLDHFWPLARRFGATTFSAVPTVLAALLDKPWPEDGVPTLRNVLCGAAPLPRQVAVDFERRTGVRVHEGYGLTESTCVSTVNPPRGERQLGTVGLRIPYQEIGLFALGRHGKPIAEAAAPDQAGVIGLRGPNVFAGYLRDADNEDAWIAPGWFNTGDLGRWDEAGRLVLCGRAKDLIIRGGHNIDPRLIEDALASHPAVAMAAAVGQPDRHAGELPVAYVALRPGADASPLTLLEHARARIPERAAVPVLIERVSALPLTTVGKISKPHLRMLATDRVLRDALDAQGLHDITCASRLAAGGGIEVQLRGPAPHMPAALALAERYPISVHWQEPTA
jgi:fatty-acyl-CoA synthase